MHHYASTKNNIKDRYQRENEIWDKANIAENKEKVIGIFSDRARVLGGLPDVVTIQEGKV